MIRENLLLVAIACLLLVEAVIVWLLERLEWVADGLLDELEKIQKKKKGAVDA